MVMRMSNICFNCKKACGGCSWSELDETTGEVRFEPVDGWDAEKINFDVGGKVIETYRIKGCPQFERDEPRSHTIGEISDDDFRTLLAVWKWRDEHGRA